MPAPSLRTPLRTDGSKILDADGTLVKLAAVNIGGFPLYFEQWVGGHTLQKVLDGVRQIGFNSIRLPISSQLFLDPSLAHCEGDPKVINRNDIRVNHPDLADKTPIELLDYFIAEAGRRGLGVILDLHKNRHQDFETDLWYQTAQPDDPSDTIFVGFNDPQNHWTDRTNEPTFMKLWEALAQRYRGNLTVIGYDLFNEPHGRATWGDGGPTDWRRAAERVGSAIQQVDATKLLIIEGIGADAPGRLPADRQVRAAWWGGNLNRAAEFPIHRHLRNVVYSPHDYGPSVSCQFWLCPTVNPTAMREVWERLWGYLARADIAPIWVGEMGQPDLSQEDPGGQQVRQLLDYLHEIGEHFSYWVLHDGASGDTGGLALATPPHGKVKGGTLAVILEKLEVLRPYLSAPDAAFGGGRVVCRNGFVPVYEPFDTTTQPDFPPAPRIVKVVEEVVPIDRPTIVTGPDPDDLAHCAA